MNENFKTIGNCPNITLIANNTITDKFNNLFTGAHTHLLFNPSNKNSGACYGCRYLTIKNFPP